VVDSSREDAGRASPLFDDAMSWRSAVSVGLFEYVDHDDDAGAGWLAAA
jgi:hypothetical protein